MSPKRDILDYLTDIVDFNRLRQGGVDVLEDGNCYILHHKMIVIDERR
jgi:phosphatidylserine/phosphatidylglycerophosphate/cardiolipin synthase-like enzyme